MQVSDIPVSLLYQTVQVVSEKLAKMKNEDLKKGVRVVDVWNHKFATIIGVGAKQVKVTYDDGINTQMAVWNFLQLFEIA